MADRLIGSPRRHASGVLEVRESAAELTGTSKDYSPLIALTRDARFVLLGEASHGTHEFYFERAEITKQLIVENGCTAVAEGDWPDAYRVNRYVRGRTNDADANAALSGFKRFPAWMWRNRVVLDFVEWLRRYNETHAPERQVGFYGIDLYSLYASIEAVLAYLDEVDPHAAARARSRYACFDHYGEESQAYGYAAAFGLDASCEDEAVDQLVELLRYAGVRRRAGAREADDFFYAEQNARLVRNAEQYYRTMFRGRVSSWNLRDRHMVETLEALAGHLARDGGAPRIAVWAHNSHLGDARATEMSDAGEWNVGQLVRERHRGDAVLIGLSTYSGTVTAASHWGGAAEVKRVRPGLEGSYEQLFHEAGVPRFFLPLRDSARVPALQKPRLQRAIGVIYRPHSERVSHYFNARLARQFDALIHIDETRALEPLEREADWTLEEAPETFPSGV